MSMKEKVKEWTAQELFNGITAYYRGHGTIGDAVLKEVERRLLELEKIWIKEAE